MRPNNILLENEYEFLNPAIREIIRKAVKGLNT